MDSNVFLAYFEKYLSESGFSKEAAHYHTVKVLKSLTASDKVKIGKVKEPAEIAKFANAYIKRLRVAAASEIQANHDMNADTLTIKQNFQNTVINSPYIDNIKQKKADNEEFKHLADTPFNVSDVVTLPVSVDDEEYVKVAVPNSKTKNTDSEKINKENSSCKTNNINVINTETIKTQKIDKIKIKSISKETLSKEGKKEYIKRMFGAAIPASIGVFVISLPVFVGYAFIAALIAFFIAFLVAVSVIGGISTLAGIIYGIIALFSSVPEGIYELGLALIILAVTLVLAISSYNIAVRWIPILWKKYTASTTEKLVLKLRIHLNKIRKECNNL